MSNANYAGPLSYKIPDAAAALGISQRSIYNLIYSGKLRRVKVGRSTVIPASDLRKVAEGIA